MLLELQLNELDLGRDIGERWLRRCGETLVPAGNLIGWSSETEGPLPGHARGRHLADFCGQTR